jgi:hypothetical protein
MARHRVVFPDWRGPVTTTTGCWSAAERRRLSNVREIIVASLGVVPANVK